MCQAYAINGAGHLSAATEYPAEALGHPDRMREWDTAHARATLTIRARSLEEHQGLLRLKWWCEDNETSTCRMIIAQAQGLLGAVDAVRPLKKDGPMVVNIQQQNTFVHQVERPRRLDSSFDSISKGALSGTTRRIALDSLVILKALQMRQSFCFTDFPELSPNCFRKVVLRLNHREFVGPVEPRTCPRFYKLTPKLLMRLVPVNTRVRPVDVQKEGLR
jgi:hypothetical protein